MEERSRDGRKWLAFCCATLLELPVLIALARTIAPETSVLATAVLMVVAVGLNWAVLEHGLYR